MACAFLTGFVAWGTFLSLLGRRVVNSVVAALVATVVTMPLVSWIVFQNRATLTKEQIDLAIDVGRCVVIPIALLALSAWFVRRWPEDRWPPLIERSLEFLRRLLARRDVIAEREQDMLEREQALRATIRATGVPQAAEVGRESAVNFRTYLATSRAGFGWLIRNDRWSPTTLAAVRLLWVEVRRAGKVVAIAAVICVGLIVFSACLPRYVRLGSPLDGNALPYQMLVLLPFACGLATFLPEHKQFPFLSHHGVSSIAVWGIKLIVWWSAALLLSASVFLLVALTHRTDIFSAQWGNIFDLFDVSASSGAIGYVDALQSYLVAPFERLLWLTEAEEIASRSIFWWIIVGRWVTFATASFAIGQFMSVVVPRGVAASALGLFLVVLGIPFVIGMMHLHVPLWLSVVPLCVALLLASWVRCRAWIDEWPRWRTTWRVGRTLFFSIVATYVAAGWYRVAEVPAVRWASVVRGRLSAGAVERMRLKLWNDAAETDQFRRHVKQHVPELPEISGWRMVLHEGAAIQDEGRLKGARIWRQHSLDERTAEAVREHTAWAANVVGLWKRTDFNFVTASRGLDPWFFHFKWVTDRVELMAILLRLDAARLAESGRFDESVERIQALSRLAEVEAQSGGTQQLLMSLNVEIASVDALANWVGQPKCSPERLEKARQLFGTRPWFGNDDKLIAEALNLDRQLYGRLLEHAWSTQTDLRVIDWLAPWERERARRLVELSVVSDWQMLQVGHTGFYWDTWHGRAGAWTRETRRATYEVVRQQMTALMERTAGLEAAPEFDRLSLVRRPGMSRLLEFFTTLNIHRVGCQMLLAFQENRLRNQRLPETWEEVAGRELANWGDAVYSLRIEFGISYWPDGLPITIAFANRTITEGTPCFTLGDPGRFQLRQAMVKSKDEPPAMRWVIGSATSVPEDVPLTDAVAYPLVP